MNAQPFHNSTKIPKSWLFMQFRKENCCELQYNSKQTQVSRVKYPSTQVYSFHIKARKQEEFPANSTSLN